MTMGPLYVLLGAVSIQVLCPFLNWIVCLCGVEFYEFFVYIQRLNPYLLYHCQICSLTQSVLFHFYDGFFSCAEAFFFVSFISLALGDISAKILSCEIYEILLPMFSSRIFYGFESNILVFNPF